MKTIISLLILLSFAYILSGCSGLDKLTEEETMVDPETGKVINKKAISSDERVEIAIDNKKVDIIKNAKVEVKNDSGEVFVTNSDGLFMGVIYNPHPQAVQHLLLTTPSGEVITNDDINPKEFREVYAFRPSGKYHLIATWTLGVHQSTFDVLFPDGTAKCRDKRGIKCHFKTFGYGLAGF